VTVEKLLKPGGQGEPYLVLDQSSVQKAVLKVFHQNFCNPETAKRLRFLVQQDLPSFSCVLCGPIDSITNGGLMGQLSPYFPGKSLDEAVANPEFSFTQAVGLAIALSHGVHVLHSRGIAHGDLHAENVLVRMNGTVLEGGLIDFDNFAATGVPAPQCVGHNLYIPPEIRLAMTNGGTPIPTIESDRFELAALLHEILLLKHFAAGNDATEAEFQNAMTSGIWLHGPEREITAGNAIGGYPVTVLDTTLNRLFRLSVSLDPGGRPSAKTWQDALKDTLQKIYACPNCGGPSVIDTSKVTCPLCGNPYPVPTLIIGASGRKLALTSGSVTIGRSDLDNSLKVSSRHAIVRRVGPEAWLESVGRNGSFRRAGSSWIKLPDGRAVLLQSGDRLLLGDQEVYVS
jgi:DNA-binding helix-hairpin-helix protein with protein kinase domain